MRATSLDLSSVLSLLLRQKWWILLTGILASALCLSLERSLPPRFTSQGALMASAQQPEIPELSIGSTAPTVEGEAIQTVTDTIRSRGFLASIASQLDLADAANLQPNGPLLARIAAIISPLTRVFGPPTGLPSAADAAARAVDYLQNNLKLEAKDHSDLLSIQFTAGAPALAANVINATMEHFIATDIAARQAQISQVNQWLSARAQDLRTEVDAEDARIATFLKSHDFGQVQGSSVAALQSSNAQAQLAAARQILARQQASLDTARQMAAHGGAASTQESLASPLIQALRTREAELVQKIGGLASLHPDRLRAQDELHAVRAQIATETDRILASLVRDTDIARSNVQALEQSANGAKLDARSSSAADAYYAQLTRDAEAKRQLYNAFLIRANETQLATAQFPSARVLFPATPPAEPDSTNAMLPLLLGFLAGSFTATSMVILRNMLRDRINSTQDIMSATGLSVFGSLPEVPRRLWRDGPARQQVQSPIDETLRAMWLAMRAMTLDTEAGQGSIVSETCLTVVVTSSDVGEGKTTVAAALASRIAADGFRVMLIDADLRRPRLMSALSLRPTGRLESVLAGTVRLEEALIADTTSGLDCLLADGGSANPMKLLASPEFAALLNNLRRTYDFVVLDSPPVLRVADAVLLSEMAELTLFVVQCGRMTTELVAEAVRRFPLPRRQKIMALLTRVPDSRKDQRDYYGGYGTKIPYSERRPAPIGVLQSAKPERIA